MNAKMVKSLTDSALSSLLEKLVTAEKKTTAEILKVLKEVDARRLYLKLGHSSLFAYLTHGLKYTPAAAQRRIDGARLLREFPEIRENLENGSINLTQISMLAQGLRHRKIDREEKKVLMGRLKDQNLLSTQEILCKDLDLPIINYEKDRLQKDNSHRLELSFSAEQMNDLIRTKELLSHTMPGAKWSEVISYMSHDFLKRRDPLLRKPKEKSDSDATANPNPERTSAAEVTVHPKLNRTSAPEVTARHIPATVKYAVFQRDRCCQWKENGKICGSRFQLQPDHRIPVWAGGRADVGNLQLLCSQHNALKYRLESGTKIVG